jgi:hypothetical protein
MTMGERGVLPYALVVTGPLQAQQHANGAGQQQRLELEVNIQREVR